MATHFVVQSLLACLRSTGNFPRDSWSRHADCPQPRHPERPRPRTWRCQFAGPEDDSAFGAFSSFAMAAVSNSPTCFQNFPSRKQNANSCSGVNSARLDSTTAEGTCRRITRFSNTHRFEFRACRDPRQVSSERRLEQESIGRSVLEPLRFGTSHGEWSGCPCLT